MRVYNIDEVIQQLEELKSTLTEDKEKNLDGITGLSMLKL